MTTPGRVAVTLGTLRIPPTYFAVQHSAWLEQLPGAAWRTRTIAMAMEIDDHQIAAGGLDLLETTVAPGGTFRRRELAMPLSFGRMTRAIVSFEPDLVHQHFATWSTPAVRAHERTGVALIVTVHGADVFAALRPLSAVAPRARPMLAWHHRSVRRALAASSRVLAVSRFLADRAIEAGAAADRVRVHYQGIDTDYFSPPERARAGLPEVLFVGAWTAAKGIPDLLSASIAAVGRSPHRLILVGRGPLEPQIRAAAEEHPHIEVVGALPRDAVRDRLRRARVLVLPTQENRGAREAAGLVLLEAQACGVPVIAYDSGGAPEMLDRDRTGLVVAERDTAALTDAITQVLGLGDLEHTRMAADARAWVQEHRSLAASVDELAAVYADAAGR